MERRTSSIEKYLIEEVDEAVPVFLQYRTNPDLEPIIHMIDNDNENAINNFVYWIDNNGRLIMSSGLSSKMTKEKLILMNSWNHPNKALVNINITDEDGDTWNLVMTADDAYYNGEFLGKVFVGKNITILQIIQDKYLSFISVLIIIMMGVTFIFADRMAGRAMIPIIESFDKQNKFVADASHEMRTPLSVMLSSIDLIKTSSKDSVELKEGIKTEILNMRSLVNELLDLARFDINNSHIRYKPFNLNDAVKDVIKSISVMAKNKDIKIHNNGKDITINADEKKIKQVIYILLDNAIKYSDDNKNIYVALEEDKTGVLFKIKDEGIGIPKDEQSLVFDRFYRVNKARSRSIGGSGLGLAIAAEIIKLHNSAISVESDEKSGSEFSFKLKK
jgi:signal transduction histidine kinase